MSVAINFEQQILEEASASPVVAVMRLSLEIDRELRKLLAVEGRLGEYQGEMPEAVELLQKGNSLLLPRELKDSLTQFWSVRNTVVHGQPMPEHFALRAVDYGLRLLRIVKSIPRHSYVVTAGSLTVYKDSRCTLQRPDVRGVVLETFSPEGESVGRQIFPTTKNYTMGESVTWEWNTQNRKGWGETWYHDPDSNTIKLAWNGSLEFTGRDIDSV